ncbi:MAG: Lrp/AsnC ligand binding domain-containing protein [Euryarchaeota archaeon]|nr:Lrp/AsnC ligand binding domain-containing protein [Euryarchaeota archaeon]
MVKSDEYEKVISTYYGEEAVTALIMLKVDTKIADSVAKKVAEFKNVEDVFMVTGDVDIILKTSFGQYKDLKQFVLENLSKIEGIKDTRTLMVVTAYKERGNVVLEEKK